MKMCQMNHKYYAYIAVILLTGIQLLVFPDVVSAQYRGSRELPEDNYLGRKGILYASTGGYYAQPIHDFKEPGMGAAEHTFGWKVGFGGWITSNITTGFEYGSFINNRYTDNHPFSLGSYASVSWMGYESTYWQVLFRYHTLVEQRIIPYILLGGGRINSTFLLDAYVSGETERINLASGSSIIVSYGLGANVVMAKHVALGLEIHAMEWSNTRFIPNTEIWGIFRFGLHLSYHF